MAYTSSVQQTFKHNRERKNVILGGAVILICITALSCVSSFTIYKGGFADMPFIFQQVLSLFAVAIVEGAFVWLVYGFTRAFSSAMERLVALCGMGFLVCVMLINLVTHFMMVKHIELSGFQQAWIAWGAITVFIAVLLIVLFITLADPVIRLIRLELRYLGKQQETILDAKTESLNSPQVAEAMADRAVIEAEVLADRIIHEGRPRQLPPQPRPAQPHFASAQTRVNGSGTGTGQLAASRTAQGEDEKPLTPLQARLAALGRGNAPFEASRNDDDIDADEPDFAASRTQPRRAVKTAASAGAGQQSKTITYNGLRFRIRLNDRGHRVMLVTNDSERRAEPYLVSLRRNEWASVARDKAAFVDLVKEKLGARIANAADGEKPKLRALLKTIKAA